MSYKIEFMYVTCSLIICNNNLIYAYFYFMLIVLMDILILIYNSYILSMFLFIIKGGMLYC